MRISVIVPTYNEEKMIGRCLKAIRAQKFKDYELIVVDGHSEDNTIKIAKKYADSIFFDAGKGAAAARNLAARKARGEILAFTDADTVVCKNWLWTIDQDFKQNIIGLGGSFSSLDGGKKDKLFMEGISKMLELMSTVVPFFSGNNCAYLKSAFLKAHGFREDLFMLDDTEFSMRMKNFGRTNFDKDLCVRTSVRRMRKSGYIGNAIKYVSAYFALFFGLRLGKGYIREVKR